MTNDRELKLNFLFNKLVKQPIARIYQYKYVMDNSFTKNTLIYPFLLHELIDGDF